MATGGDRLRRRRIVLWQSDPFCRRCRVLTVLPEHLAQFYGIPFDDKLLKRLPADAAEIMATIEHQTTRLEDERWINPRCTERTTLFCSRCNQESATECERRTSLAKRRQERETRIYLAKQRRWGITLGEALGITENHGKGQEGEAAAEGEPGAGTP